MWSIRSGGDDEQGGGDGEDDEQGDGDNMMMSKVVLCE